MELMSAARRDVGVYMIRDMIKMVSDYYYTIFFISLFLRNEIRYNNNCKTTGHRMYGDERKAQESWKEGFV